MKYEPPKMEAILISIAHVRVLSLSLPANEVTHMLLQIVLHLINEY